MGSLQLQPRVGSFYAGDHTGIIGTIAAGAEVFQLRNPDASKLVLIDRVMVAMVNAAAVTAAQEFGFDVMKATGWSAVGTGGTALVPNKRRTGMAASMLGANDLRIATTAALGAGTKTLDTQKVASGAGPLVNAIGAVGPLCSFGDVNSVSDPLLVLAQNEGMVIRNLVAYATGSARFHVLVLWREVSANDWV